MKELVLEEIKNLYEQKKTLHEIGQSFECSKNKIKRFLKNNNVAIRTRGESQRSDDADKEIVQDYLQGVKVGFLCQRYNCKAPKIYRVLKRNNIIIDRKDNWEKSIDKRLMLELYEEHKNITHVADIMCISTATVYKWLKRKGIEIQENIHRGENHWRWKGGISLGGENHRKTEEYLLWRKKIFARDGFKCCVCGSKEHIQAHHIIAVSADISLIVVLSNGITLCKKCHEKTYGKENDFIDYFKGLIEGKVLDESKFKDYFTKPVVVEPVLCACGCGQYTKVIGEKRNKFIHGHAIRVIKPIRTKVQEKTVFTNELIEKIKELYLNQKSTCEISEELNVSTGGVAKVIKQLGISRTLSEAQRLRFSK